MTTTQEIVEQELTEIADTMAPAKSAQNDAEAAFNRELQFHTDYERELEEENKCVWHYENVDVVEFTWMHYGKRLSLLTKGSTTILNTMILIAETNPGIMFQLEQDMTIRISDYKI